MPSKQATRLMLTVFQIFATFSLTPFMRGHASQTLRRQMGERLSPLLQQYQFRFIDERPIHKTWCMLRKSCFHAHFFGRGAGTQCVFFNRNQVVQDNGLPLVGNDQNMGCLPHISCIPQHGQRYLGQSIQGCWLHEITYLQVFSSHRAGNRSQAQGRAATRKQILGPGLTLAPPPWYNRSRVLYASMAIARLEAGANGYGCRASAQAKPVLAEGFPASRKPAESTSERSAKPPQVLQPQRLRKVRKGLESKFFF